MCGGPWRGIALFADGQVVCYELSWPIMGLINNPVVDFNRIVVKIVSKLYVHCTILSSRGGLVLIYLIVIEHLQL